MQHKDLVFPCTCSRQDLRDFEGVYPGTCRHLSFQQVEAGIEEFAIRCRVDERDIAFKDLIQGQQLQNLQHDCGDFVIRRKDGLFAYQLAVVIDDAWQGVTHIIRGTDLLDSTTRQIYLQQCLNLPQPVYGHIPVIVNQDGQKLSKQHHAPALDLKKPGKTLFSALQYLQQAPPPSLQKAPVSELLSWAVQHWAPLKMANLVQVDENQGLISP